MPLRMGMFSGSGRVQSTTSSFRRPLFVAATRRRNSIKYTAVDLPVGRLIEFEGWTLIAVYLADF